MAKKDVAEAAPLEINSANIGTLHLDEIDAPYVNLDGEAQIHARLRVGQVEYVWERSMPVQGHSAMLPEAVTQLTAEGRRLLIAERDDRYLLYVAPQ